MQKWEYNHIEITIGYMSSSDPTFKAGNTIGTLISNDATVFDSADFRARQKSPTERFTLAEYLAELGAEGWELITMIKIDQNGSVRELIFKRPIE